MSNSEEIITRVSELSNQFVRQLNDLVDTFVDSNVHIKGPLVGMAVIEANANVIASMIACVCEIVKQDPAVMAAHVGEQIVRLSVLAAEEGAKRK